MCQWSAKYTDLDAVKRWKSVARTIENYDEVIGAKNGKNGCINVKTVSWASFYFAVHTVWWEKKLKMKEHVKHERNWGILFHLKLGKIVFLVHGEIFYFTQKPLYRVTFMILNLRDGLLERFDFWITFLRDEINLPLQLLRSD